MVDALRLSRLELFVPIMAGACVAWFLIDSKAFALIFGRFNTSLTFAEALELRGLTYLLTPIYWNLGRAAVIARLHSARHVPILEATSSMAFYQTLDAILLSRLCWIGLSAMPSNLRLASLSPLVAATFLILVGYMLVIRTNRPAFGPLDRLRASTFHRTHRLAQTRQIIAILSLRIAYYAVFVSVYFGGTSAFGIDLPFALIIASVPIIQAIGALPISPAGLGTQQAAMLFLFSGFGADAAIVAFGLTFPILAIAFRSMIGWLYIGRISQSDTKPALEPSRLPHADPFD